MENKKNDVSEFYKYSDDDTNYIIIRGLDFIKDKDFKKNTEILEVKENKDNLTLVFDFENLSKTLIASKFRDILIIFKDHKNLNLVIKNCLISDENKGSNNSDKDNKFYFDDIDLKCNILYISDELYSISPYVDIYFKKLKAKKLILKHFKINSNLQLDNFFNYIINTECEELELEDIYVELIIKKDEKDETYNNLKQYITFENGNFYLIKEEENKKLNLKTLKLKDCPLFAISEDTFKNINNDISIDIDENSLINPDITTQFKINKGYTEICYDLDSFKLSKDEEKEDDEDGDEDEKKEEDYLYYLDYIFDIILDNENNIKYKKIKFKNFDKTKYEYITDENLTFIDEKNWVFNEEEKKLKKKFEDFNKKINTRINNNLNKLIDIKELIFDNCSNYFIQLVLKFIQKNNESNKNLEYLKLKKCAKEHFDIKSILSLNLKYLILFDIPLKLQKFPSNDKLGKIENLTIKISGLEHYCKSNNLNYYRTIEIIVDLIENEKFNKNLSFEMIALPTIMTFLVEKNLRQIEKVEEEKLIRTYFSFENYEDRNNVAKQSFILKGVNDSILLKGKNIILKKNNIKSFYENYECLSGSKSLDKEIKKTDFGSDLFDLNEDFRQFLKVNKINNVTFENCLFESTKNLKYYKKKGKESIKETIINLVEGKKFNMKLDMKTLKEVIYKNKSIGDITYILKYMTLDSQKEYNQDTKDFLKIIEDFCRSLENFFYVLEKEKITIILNDIKDRKEFFCLLNLLKAIKEDCHDKRIFKFTDKGGIKEEKYTIPNFSGLFGPYFLKEKNEEEDKEFSSVFNYYYTSEEENKLFGKLGEEKSVIEFKTTKNEINSFYIESRYKNKKFWDIVYS